MSQPYSDTYRQFCKGIEEQAAEKLKRPLSEAEQLAIRNTGSLMLLDSLALSIDLAKTDAQVVDVLTDIDSVSTEQLQITLDNLVELVGSSLGRTLSTEEVAKLRSFATVEEALKLAEQLDRILPRKREQFLKIFLNP